MAPLEPPKMRGHNSAIYHLDDSPWLPSPEAPPATEADAAYEALRLGGVYAHRVIPEPTPITVGPDDQPYIEGIGGRGSWPTPEGKVSMTFDDHGGAVIVSEIACRLMLGNGKVVVLGANQRYRIPPTAAWITLSMAHAVTAVGMQNNGGKKEPWFRKFDKPKKKGRSK